MPNYPIATRPKPILKARQTHLTFTIPQPQPPTESRAVPMSHRVQKTLTDPTARVRKSLAQAIDYDTLTPSKQRGWDLGNYGSIELKNIKGHFYYYLRWREPKTNKNRSTYLGKDWDKAIAKLKELTNPH
jgi:hypothetical protein